MKVSEALTVIGDYTADQWGMVTSAQATAAGVDSVTLYRLADAGHLEPVRRGVYAAATAPASQHRDVQAAWLVLNPSVPAWKRPKLDPDGAVVSHRAAALIHEIGDMLVGRIELTVPRRRGTRDPQVQLRQRELAEADVTLVDGLPVTTTVRTIEDLLADHVEGDHVASAIMDGVRAGKLDLAVLAERAGPYARRYGVKSRDGDQLIDFLLEQIGHSRSVLTRRANDRAAVSLMSPQLREALAQIGARAVMSPEVQQQLAGLQRSHASTIAAIVGQLPDIRTSALVGISDQIKALQQSPAAMVKLSELVNPAVRAATRGLPPAQPRSAGDADSEDQ